MTKFNKINVFLLTLALITSSFGFQANAASAPTLGDQSANVTGTHNAVLSVFVNPNGSTTELHFKYWTGSNFKERLYLGVTGTSSVRIEVGLINLLEGSEYSYQIVAVNSYGTTTGSIGSFNTSGSSTSSGSTSSNSNNNSSGTGSNTSTSQSAPLVSTNGPTTISANSATISGTVNPNGNSTSFWFEFGTTQSLGQTTNTQIVGSGNTQISVTGTLTNLENNKTYYYRVVAQNSYGRNSGLIWYFNTGTNQTGSTGQSGTNGQVLGAVSGSGTNTGTVSGNNSVSSGTTGTTSTTSKTGTSSTPKTTTKTATNTNPRPSFISMEYSLDSNGALVLVVNNLKPKPGEEFSYTIITKNDNQTSFNETNLKVLLPVEVEYVGSNFDPLRMSGTVLEFDLGTVPPLSQTAIVITVRVKDTVKPGTNMIFTSVLGYKDKTGTQLATTSYMTVKVGSGGSGISLSAFSLGSLATSTGALVLFAVGLLVLMVLLTYKFVKIRNGKNGKNKKSEEDIFSKGGIPSTFEPISDGSFPRR